MLINLLGLKTLDILIMSIGCPRRYMGLIKPQELRLRDFLIEKGFTIGKVDTILFTKKLDGENFICQVYVDDIIFGSSNEDYCMEFGELMSKEFKMSMIGELIFFLGFQVKQMREDFHLSRKIYQGPSQEVQNG
jgi:hypothetical protein